LSTVSATDVKSLRERTGAGMMDCKRALEATAGNMEQAVEELRKKGLARAAKKAQREASEGLVEAYIHADGKIGVLVELDCETDFVARTADFKDLAHTLALQVAAAAPRFVSRDEVPQALLEHEASILRAQAGNSGKPEAVLERIVEGRIEKFYGEICLLEQPFVKDPKLRVRDLVAQAVARVGENIIVRRFSRFEVGAAAETPSGEKIEDGAGAPS